MNRICFNFARKKTLKLISHLDMLRLFHRALRRSGLPLAYSKGYSPHPRFNLALPLPLNTTSSEEWGEVLFEKKVTPEIFCESLGGQLPEGLHLIKAEEEDLKSPALPARVKGTLYKAFLLTLDREQKLPFPGLEHLISELLAKEEILLTRINKKKKKYKVNVRPHILDMSLVKVNQEVVISMLLRAGNEGGVSPYFVLQHLQGEKSFCLTGAYWELHREKIYFDDQILKFSTSEGM